MGQIRIWHNLNFKKGITKGLKCKNENLKAKMGFYLIDLAKHGLMGKIKISYILVSKREKKRVERERRERERKEDEEEEEEGEGGAKIKQSQAPKRYGTNLDYGFYKIWHGSLGLYDD